MIEASANAITVIIFQYIKVSNQQIVKPNPSSVPDVKLNLRDRVWGEVEKNSFTALPGKEGHRGLMLSKLCVPTWRGW